MVREITLLIADKGGKNLLVAGGMGSRGMQLIDMSGDGKDCATPNDIDDVINPWFPTPNLMTADGEPFFCAGRTVDFFGVEHNICKTFDKDAKDWLSTTDYLYGDGAYGVPFGDGSYWIVGGTGGPNNSHCYNGDGTITNGPDIPDDSLYNCALQISDDETLIINKVAYVYSHSSKIWTQLGEYDLADGTMPKSWKFPVCGLTLDLYRNPKYAVVAGGRFHGRNTLMLDIETRQWMHGPDLPYSLWSAATVQYRNGFLVTGGVSPMNGEHIWTKPIIEVDPLAVDWIIRDEELKTPKFFHYAIMLDESVFTC